MPQISYNAMSDTDQEVLKHFAQQAEKEYDKARQAQLQSQMYPQDKSAVMMGACVPSGVFTMYGPVEAPPKQPSPTIQEIVDKRIACLQAQLTKLERIKANGLLSLTRDEMLDLIHGIY